ncbi:MAG: hypothetical protein RSA94_01955 [Mucinivorans sp.]
MKKIINILFLLLLLMVGSGCDEKKESYRGAVALIFPSLTQGEPRWLEEQKRLNSDFFAANYSVLIGATVDGDQVKQVEYIDKIRALGVQYLIIASSDTLSQLTNVALEKFVSSGGRVLCYDRLQMGTKSVSGFVSPGLSIVGDMVDRAVHVIVKWGEGGVPFGVGVVGNGVCEVPVF